MKQLGGKIKLCYYRSLPGNHSRFMVQEIGRAGDCNSILKESRITNRQTSFSRTDIWQLIMGHQTSGSAQLSPCEPRTYPRHSLNAPT